jgi:hypothetical protein
VAGPASKRSVSPPGSSATAADPWPTSRIVIRIGSGSGRGRKGRRSGSSERSRRRLLRNERSGSGRRSTNRAARSERERLKAGRGGVQAAIFSTTTRKRARDPHVADSRIESIAG